MSGPDAEMDGFLWGNAYPDAVPTPRPHQCRTCAFRKAPESVRGAMSLAKLIRETADFDDFVCHEAHDGIHMRCRGWHLLQEESRGS